MRALLLCGAFVFLFACGGVSWQVTPVASCDPANHSLLTNNNRWQETFASASAGAPACLRMSWGSGPNEAKSFYIQLDINGHMSLFDEASGQFAPSTQLTFPVTQPNAEVRFDIFVFGSEPSSDTKRLEVCGEAMKDPAYECKPNASGDCWFAINFVPTRKGDPQPEPTGKKCQLQLPEPGPEPIIEPPGPTELPGPDASPPEPSQPEPLEPSAPDQLPHDSTRPDGPVIDALPSGSWVETLGGTQGDITSVAIAKDSKGALYLTGSFATRLMIDTKEDPVDKANAGVDLFVAKINPAARWVQWLRIISTQRDEKAGGIAVAGTGANEHIYVTGVIADGTVTAANKILNSRPQGAFVAKFNTAGQLIWLNSAGETANITANAIAVSEQGDAYITGSFEGKASFDGTSKKTSVHQLYVAHFQAKDGDMTWVLTADTSNPNTSFGQDLLIDKQNTNTLYVTGNYVKSTKLGSTPSPSQTSHNKAFLVSIDRINGNDKFGNVIWLESTDEITGDALAHDGNNLFLAGTLDQGGTVGTKTPINLSVKDRRRGSFIVRFNPGMQSGWGRIISGDGKHEVKALRADKGHVYLTGELLGSALYFQASSTPKQIESFLSQPGKRGFLVKISSAGAHVNSSVLQHSERSSFTDLATGSGTQLFITGYFKSSANFGGKTFKNKGFLSAFLWSVAP